MPLLPASVLTGHAPSRGQAPGSVRSKRLKKLVAGRLVRAQPSGRQQLYSIASEPVVERRWITKREASRIVTVTEAGQDGPREWLGLDLAALRAAA